MSNKYDVIIIGAGIGGLSSGAVLSRNGMNVLVLEKNHVPGGYAVNFKRGNFEFDVSSHLINNLDCIGDIPYSMLEECGIKNSVRLLSSKYLYRSIFPDFDIRVPQCNPHEYLNLLKTYFPGEKHGLENLFKAMTGFFLKLERLKGSDISSSDLVLYMNSTVQGVLDKFLDDEKLKAIISQLWPYYGLPPSMLSALYFFYPWYDFINTGGYYPNGGGESISKALMNVIKTNNGEVRLNNKVENILVTEDGACGVVNSNNEKIYCKNVISNIDARTTFHDLIDEHCLPTEFIDDIDGMEPSISAFVVYLGLNVDLNIINQDDYIIFMNPGYDTDKQYEYFINNEMQSVPFSMSLYSNLDVEYAPRNKSVLSIMTLAGYDYWDGLSNAEYERQKRKFTETLIKKAEMIIPNLSSYIEVVESATPRTMRRYSGNYQGAIYGWSQCVAQSGVKRLKMKTPVNNLFLVGAWSQPGGGIKGVMRSGINMANMILRDN